MLTGLRAFLGRNRLNVGLLVFLVVFIGLLVLYVAFKDQQLASSRMEPKDFYLAQNAFLATAVQSAAGAVLLVGLIFTARQLANTEKSLELTREGQITERFTRAIEHLGSDKLEIRLGGIYALERIAWDSERDHGPVMEVLTTFVRENAHWTDRTVVGATWWRRIAIVGLSVRNTWQAMSQVRRSSFWGYHPPRADIQAAMTVIGRRKRTYRKGEELPLDLRETDLRFLRLDRAHLEGVNLALAHLESACLEGANLHGANLTFARLDGTHLSGADLRDASVLNADRIRVAYEYERALLPAGLVTELRRTGTPT